MTEKNDTSKDTADVRGKAEDQLTGMTAHRTPPRTDEESLRLVQELHVHQIELEMQNRQLRQTRDDLEKAVARYSDLYDFAPVGYFTLDGNGAIRSVNLCGASLLRIERSRLIGRQFKEFVADEDRLVFSAFLEKVLLYNGNNNCEITLTREDSTSLFAHLEAAFSSDDHECRITLSDITGLKRATDALKEREEWLKSIFNATNEVIILYDVITRTIIDVNERIYEVLGYSRNEALSLKLGDLSSKEEPYTEKFAETMMRVAETEGPLQLEWQFRRKDGSLTWTTTSLNAASIGGKNFIIAVVRDNNFRKHAEDALRENETRFSTVFSNSPIAIGISRMDDGCFVDVNDSFLSIFGYSRDEILGNTSLGLGMWPFPEEREEMFRRIQVQGRVQQYEARFRNKSGSIGYLLISSEIIELCGQHYLMGMLSDISERKRIEDELADNEERYRRLFEVESDALLMMDHESGRFLDANTAALKMYGYTTEEFLQMIHLDVSAEPDQTRQTFERHLTEVPIRWHRKKDGTIFPVEITGSFFTFKDRKVYVAAIRDITKRVQQDDELRQALEAARIANSTMSRLLRTVAHEFRTPLGLLTGSADILDRYWDRLTPDKRREQNEHIRNAARQISILLDSVLSFNQLKTDRAVNSPQLADIGEICRSIAAEVETVWSTGHQFKVTTTSNCSSAVLDMVHFRRIVENLLTNAFRYTPSDGNVSLHVRREKNRLLLEIADTGIGIPEEDQTLIFNAFYRSRNVEERRGLGLGLSIVRESLSHLDGTITVISKPGEGTTMRVKIPVDPVQARQNTLGK
jgi:PAS domain S-box-containing protein